MGRSAFGPNGFAVPLPGDLLPELLSQGGSAYGADHPRSLARSAQLAARLARIFSSQRRPSIGTPLRSRS